MFGSWIQILFFFFLFVFESINLRTPPQVWLFGNWVLYFNSNLFTVLMILSSTFWRTTNWSFQLLIYVLNIIIQYHDYYYYYFRLITY